MSSKLSILFRLYTAHYHSSSSSSQEEHETLMLHTQTTEYLIEMNIEDYGYKDPKDCKLVYN